MTVVHCASVVRASLLLEMSILQPKKQCGGRADCYLCSRKLGTRHTHLVTWSADTKKFLSDESVQVDCVNNVCVCIACSTDIRKGTWKQNAKKQAYRSNVVFLHVQSNKAFILVGA